MKKALYELILNELEIVHLADGGGDSTAIAIKHTTQDCSQDNEDIKRVADELATAMVDKIGGDQVNDWIFDPQLTKIF